MGIDNKAILLVGLPVESVDVDEDMFYDELEPAGWVCASPYYDAEFSECVIGIPLKTTRANRGFTSFPEWPATEEVFRLFEETLNEKPSIVLALHIY